MRNHAHMLMCSVPGEVALCMRRILTGHAIYYNRRHRRHSHLFQDRYKSILCEEDANFNELVRHIHLNPLRAGLVKTPAKLDRYPWCGHGVVLGRRNQAWQDRDYVLKWFGRTEPTAKRAYREFVQKGHLSGAKTGTDRRGPDTIHGRLVGG
jgi:hypothetical protein